MIDSAEKSSGLGMSKPTAVKLETMFVPNPANPSSTISPPIVVPALTAFPWSPTAGLKKDFEPKPNIRSVKTSVAPYPKTSLYLFIPVSPRLSADSAPLAAPMAAA